MLICSAKGCRREATWQLRWNNPKLHEPARRKLWLACDEHRDPLAAFLRARDFLRDIVPAAASTGAGATSTDPVTHFPHTPEVGDDEPSTPSPRGSDQNVVGRDG
jgi:hypothetical protein